MKELIRFAKILMAVIFCAISLAALFYLLLLILSWALASTQNTWIVILGVVIFVLTMMIHDITKEVKL